MTSIMGEIGARNQPPVAAGSPESWRLSQLELIRQKAEGLLDQAQWGAQSPDERSTSYISERSKRERGARQGETQLTIVELIRDGSGLMVGLSRFKKDVRGELSPRTGHPTLLMDFPKVGDGTVVRPSFLPDEDFVSSVEVLCDAMIEEDPGTSMGPTYHGRVQLEADLRRTLRNENVPQASPSYVTPTTPTARFAANLALGSQ